MNSILNYHVIDPNNIGDLLSAPTHYFSFPNYQSNRADIRTVDAAIAAQNHSIVGGGGLLYTRFLDSITTLVASKRGKLIAWGVGQQTYKAINTTDPELLNVLQCLSAFDLIGIRDVNQGYDWVPCASCMHPEFDQPRSIQHEFVVFSHKKFRLAIQGLPWLSNDVTDMNTVLDFLGSGETILTSSYHGAYWGTLLGRRVLAFPFSSKFYSLKHRPGIFPTQKWQANTQTIKLLGKVLYTLGDSNVLLCQTDGWQTYVPSCPTYPNALEECRDRNRWFYQRVLQILD